MSDADSAAGGSDDGQKPKKTKIDLKSRLSGVRASGSMAAVSRPSDDPLSFPPPALQGSVPPPKMLSQSGAAFVPPVSVSSAFAPPPPPPAPVKVTAAQQTIQVDENQIVEERQRTAKKWRTYVLLAAVVCLGLGGAIGTLIKGGEQGRTAVKGAKDLSKDVGAAVTTMKDLSDQLMRGQEGFGNEQFPDDLAAFVRQNKVAFDAAKFEGRGVGAYPKELFVALIKFTKGVEDLNKKIDRLSGQLNNAKVKEGISKYWTTKKEPVVNFSILLDKRGEDYFAILVPNKQPFPLKGAAPGEYAVTKPPSGNEKEGKEVKAKRLTATSKLEETPLVPVDESSVARFTSQQVVAQLAVVLGETRGLIEGQAAADGSGDTEAGLIKQGDDISAALAKIGR
ncbi:MAG: hypothetical protein FJ096_16515 [Deltaproteobacteria bacterium]|nr:hypothetical protein [Deltaproteobacteria bacterium]